VKYNGLDTTDRLTSLKNLKALGLFVKTGIIPSSEYLESCAKNSGVLSWTRIMNTLEREGYELFFTLLKGLGLFQNMTVTASYRRLCVTD
jgi:hypothetical protein